MNNEQNERPNFGCKQIETKNGKCTFSYQNGMFSEKGVVSLHSGFGIGLPNNLDEVS